MIKIENPMGKMNISQNYFAELVGHAAQNCFGVTNMVPYSAYQGISSVFKKEMPNKIVEFLKLFDFLMASFYILNRTKPHILIIGQKKLGLVLTVNITMQVKAE